MSQCHAQGEHLFTYPKSPRHVLLKPRASLRVHVPKQGSGFGGSGFRIQVLGFSINNIYIGPEVSM